jgi:hypothetical protein
MNKSTHSVTVGFARLTEDSGLRRDCWEHAQHLTRRAGYTVRAQKGATAFDDLQEIIQWCTTWLGHLFAFFRLTPLVLFASQRVLALPPWPQRPMPLISFQRVRLRAA